MLNNKSIGSTIVAPTMKTTVRPIFSILLLIVFATSLTCRILLRRTGGEGGFGIRVRSFEPIRQTNVTVESQVPVFNSTLLKYAAIDISEPQTKKEVEQLLDGNFGSLDRYKTFATWRRFNTHDADARSPQLFGFWLEFRRRLNRWSRDLMYQPGVMNDLVELVRDPIDRHNKKYSSCAVVGNSGILLQKEYGELIDGHEAVFRLNNAWIDRFEKNVGLKTTISFINSNILHLCARRLGCFCHPYGANVPIIMYICQPVHLLDHTLCNSSHKAPLIVTDPRFDVLCTRIVKYYSLKRFAEETGKSLDEWSSARDGPMFHYSSGLQAVMLAVGVCDRVSLVGFGKSASAKHHYHTNQKGELHLHHYEAEYDLYHDLVNHPKAIPFVSDSFKFPPVTIYQ